MTKKIEIHIDLTPREIESLIWDLPSDQQAGLLIAMGKRYRTNHADVCQQLEDIDAELSGTGEFGNSYSLEDRYATLAALKAVLRHIENREIIAKEEGSNKWVAVSERHPEESGIYFVTDRKYRVFLDTYIRESNKWYASCPVAWQPFPTPYLESEDE